MGIWAKVVEPLWLDETISEVIKLGKSKTC